VERYKARLVAKGFTQQHGVDFFEVWAPTGRLSCYRTLLAYAAHHNLQVQLLDFKTAFLNGPLHEELYVSQPPGFDDGTTNVEPTKDVKHPRLFSDASVQVMGCVTRDSSPGVPNNEHSDTVDCLR
jgi:hypothetical protein